MSEEINIGSLLRRAIACRKELGEEEVIIDRKRAKTTAVAPLTAAPSAVAAEIDLFGDAKTSIALPAGEQFPSLTAHYEAICNCQLCPLGQTRNKFVYGVGNPQAGLMFIGEAPGADEDRLGEPFVGRAGQLLDRILAAIQLSRKEVYIANILKCRPPNNRDPLPEEMETCFPYLYEQIRLIQPKLICALGRIAAQALLKTTTPLGKLRKQWHDFNGIPVLITYHPAALLRFPSYKKDTWEDMQMLKSRYDGLI